MIDFTFIAERYNYWIFIVLMMVGLYTVISRGNLIKKLIGLNLFQTSVFIYYISIGKIAGGTAPILVGPGAHGESHGEPADHGAEGIGAGGAHADSAHAAPAGGANDLADAVGAAGTGGVEGHEAVHAAPANPPIVPPENAAHGPSFEIAQADAFAPALDAAHQAAEIIYTNPLPHVLILTAIVVGIATTAVGLALAVRIREAYGTIEEDELEAADEIAEFGHALDEEAPAR